MIKKVVENYFFCDYSLSCKLQNILWIVKCTCIFQLTLYIIVFYINLLIYGSEEQPDPCTCILPLVIRVDCVVSQLFIGQEQMCRVSIIPGSWSTLLSLVIRDNLTAVLYEGLFELFFKVPVIMSILCMYLTSFNYSHIWFHPHCYIT